jgi:hypothetical protein
MGVVWYNDRMSKVTTATCPVCGAPLDILPPDETRLRVFVGMVRHPAHVAACSRCEWAATITSTPGGIVVEEMV